MFEHEKKHLRDSIKAQPLAGVQQAFVTHASKGTLDDKTRDALINSLEATLDGDTRTRYLFEKNNVETALATGKAPRMPSIVLPETSLLWAINLANLAQKKGEENFYDSQLWKQFSGIDGVAQREKEQLAFYIATAGENKDARLNWGELGSSFYYSLEEKRINLDLILAMGVGFDVARAVSFHEIGHSQLTKGWGDKYNDLLGQVKELDKKGKESSLTKEEYKTLARLSAECRFRHLISDEAENNPVDRWTVNQGTRIRKDHVLARNTAEGVLVDGLLADSMSDKTDTPENRLKNVKHAIRNSFFRNNGYFTDTEKGWRDIGINPDWITTKDGKTGLEALEILKELCGGKDGVENLQPNSNDMISGAAKLAAATLDYSRKRNQKIEEIYDRFVKHLVDPMLDKQQEQLEKEMDKKDKNKEQSDGDSNDGKNQGNGQPQQGQGDTKEGQGDGKGKPGDGQGGASKSGPTDDDKIKVEGDGEGGGKGEPKDGEGKGVDKNKPEPGEGKGKGKIKVEGVGDMPEVELPPETPHQGHNANKPGANKPSEGKEPDKGQTIEELEKAREARKEYSDGDDGDQLPSDSAPRMSSGLRPARGIGLSDTKSKPLVGDWSDYQAMAVAFAPEIREWQSLIDQLRARQLEFENRLSRKHTLLPEDGDMRRLDRVSYTNMAKQILRGNMPTEDETHNFHADKKQPLPSNIDVVLLIDGSGSMHMDRGSGGKTWPFPPIKAGMHAGCIMNEACKNDALTTRHTNFYMGLWGNKEPLMLAKPGDDGNEIGKRIAGVKLNQSWGTSLAPSIRHATAQLAEGQKNQRGGMTKTGYSHIIVLSDGGIADENASYHTISKLLDNCPMSSVDFVIIENAKTEMDDLAKKLKNAYPDRVGVYHHNNTATVNDGIKTLLLERVKNTPIIPTITSDKKRATLQHAHHAMTH